MSGRIGGPVQLPKRAESRTDLPYTDTVVRHKQGPSQEPRQPGSDSIDALFASLDTIKKKANAARAAREGASTLDAGFSPQEPIGEETFRPVTPPPPASMTDQAPLSYPDTSFQANPFLEENTESSHVDRDQSPQMAEATPPEPFAGVGDQTQVPTKAAPPVATSRTYSSASHQELPSQHISPTPSYPSQPALLSAKSNGTINQRLFLAEMALQNRQVVDQYQNRKKKSPLHLNQAGEITRLLPQSNELEEGDKHIFPVFEKEHLHALRIPIGFDTSPSGQFCELSLYLSRRRDGAAVWSRAFSDVRAAQGKAEAYEVHGPASQDDLSQLTQEQMLLLSFLIAPQHSPLQQDPLFALCEIRHYAQKHRKLLRLGAKGLGAKWTLHATDMRLTPYDPHTDDPRQTHQGQLQFQLDDEQFRYISLDPIPNEAPGSGWMLDMEGKYIHRDGAKTHQGDIEELSATWMQEHLLCGYVITLMFPEFLETYLDTPTPTASYNSPQQSLIELSRPSEGAEASLLATQQDEDGALLSELHSLAAAREPLEESIAQTLTHEEVFEELDLLDSEADIQIEDLEEFEEIESIEEFEEIESIEEFEGIALLEEIEEVDEVDFLNDEADIPIEEIEEIEDLSGDFDDVFVIEEEREQPAEAQTEALVTPPPQETPLPSERVKANASLTESALIYQHGYQEEATANQSALAHSLEEGLPELELLSEEESHPSAPKEEPREEIDIFGGVQTVMQPRQQWMQMLDAQAEAAPQKPKQRPSSPLPSGVLQPQPQTHEAELVAQTNPFEPSAIPPSSQMKKQTEVAPQLSQEQLDQASGHSSTEDAVPLDALEAPIGLDGIVVGEESGEEFTSPSSPAWPTINELPPQVEQEDDLGEVTSPSMQLPQAPPLLAPIPFSSSHLQAVPGHDLPSSEEPPLPDETHYRSIQIETLPLNPRGLRLHVCVSKKFSAQPFQSPEATLQIFSQPQSHRYPELGVEIEFSYSVGTQGKVYPQVIVKRTANIRNVPFAEHSMKILANKNETLEQGYDQVQELPRGHMAKVDLSATDQVRGIMLLIVKEPNGNLAGSLKATWFTEE